MLDRWRHLQLDDQVRTIILASWSTGSRSQYKSYINKWQDYCHSIQADPRSTTIEIGTKFLLNLYNSGVGYSAICTARSALSSVVDPIEGFEFGKHPIISRFVSGVFKSRPTLPRYVCTYDPDVILQYLISLPKVDCISLKELTLKITTLLALCSGHRPQTLQFISCDEKFMKLNENSVTFYIPKPVKNTSPSFHPKPISLSRYHNKDICPVEITKAYLKATSSNRKSSQLILSYYNFAAVKVQTIRKYIKTVLLASGIDTTVFKAGSTRHSSNSSKFLQGIAVEEILRAAGWKTDSSFYKHYKLYIDEDQ